MEKVAIVGVTLWKPWRGECLFFRMPELALNKQPILPDPLGCWPGSQGCNYDNVLWAHGGSPGFLGEAKVCGIPEVEIWITGQDLSICMYVCKYVCMSEVGGGAQPGNRFVSFVRARVRACVIFPSPGKSGPPRPATAPRFGPAAALLFAFLLFLLLPFQSLPNLLSRFA